MFSKQKNKREEVNFKVATILEGAGVWVWADILKNTGATIEKAFVMFLSKKKIKKLY